MARPLADGDVPVSIQEANIGPYNGLTIEQFGFAVDSKGDMDAIFYHFQRSMFQISGNHFGEGRFHFRKLLFGGAARTGQTIKARGCRSKSVHGDVTFANVMETKWFTSAPDIITITRDTTVAHKLIKGVYVDYGKIPDVTMKLAVVALVG